MRKLITLFFAFLAFNLLGQCPYTVTASATPATCSTCCNGMITSTTSGFGCAPISFSLDPGGMTSPTGVWSNLCPGTYTVLLGTACCIAICGPITLNGGSTAIEGFETLDSQMKFYPNPASNKLFISIVDDSFKTSGIELKNTLGQTVLRTLYKSEIDISELSEGVYILQITNSKNQIAVKRLVVAR